ncbi:MAG: zinc ribbon domain-containing protein [Euryarchaeota archaeon]|nr:zinc ribbon domain-containing protein [Euryarchaeota archaeon]
MRCLRCGEPVRRRWNYCPNCGADLRRERAYERYPALLGFRGIFDEIDREFREIERMLRRLAMPGERRGGVSIRISSEPGKEPRVEVQTFGSLKNRNILPRLRARQRQPPRVTEEPETRVERRGNRVVYRLRMPGVESEEDVDVQRLRESVEVRGYARDRAYFTLFTLPRHARIASTKLEGDEFVIEVEE